MKSEPRQGMKKQNHAWIIDESKYLGENEITKFKMTCLSEKQMGIKVQKFNQIRHWFMIELGLQAGLRVSEMTSLKHRNLLLDSNKSSILVTGKGNKKRSVWIGSDFKKICLEYVNLKDQFNYDISPDSNLLINLKGNKISKRAIQKDFKNLLCKANLPSTYSIHCLRHTYTTFLLKASNNNYRFVQQQLGHASIKTTQVYAGVLESEGKKAIEELYK